MGTRNQFTIGSRRVDDSRQALAEAEHLLNQAFAVLPRASFYDDFPVWDPRHAAPGVARYGAFNEQGRLVSVAGVRMSRLRIPGGNAELPVALIGGVATAPEARGQGFASRCVSAAVEHARSHGAPLCLLWGAEHALYQRLGFELCGAQMRIPLSGLRLPPELDLEGGLRRGFSPAVFELLKQRDGGLALENSDFPWYSAHRNVSWYWIGSPERAVACAAVGRGIDLENLVHEWHGEPGALSGLLARLRGIHPEALLLTSQERLERSGLSAPTDAGLEFFCMARVFDVAAIVRAFGDAGDVGRLASERAAQMLFGPGDHTAAFDGSLKVPYPLWIWGLDAC